MDQNDPDKAAAAAAAEDNTSTEIWAKSEFTLTDAEIANFLALPLPPVGDDLDFELNPEIEELAEASLLYDLNPDVKDLLYYFRTERVTIPVEIIRHVAPFLSVKELQNCAQTAWDLRNEVNNILILRFFMARSPKLDEAFTYRAEPLVPDGMVEVEVDNAGHLGTGAEDNARIQVSGNNLGTITLGSNCHILIRGDNAGEIKVGPDSTIRILGNDRGRVVVGERSLIYIIRDHIGTIRAEGGSKDYVLIGGYRMGEIE